ncbi:MAG: hypothetical protein WCX75_00440 [Fibrobacteraceae bacterium]
MKYKSYKQVIAIIMLCTISLFSAQWDGEISKPEYQSIRDTSYFLIHTPEELAWFVTEVNSGLDIASYRYKLKYNARLMNDIVIWEGEVDSLETPQWQSMGGSLGFGGIFDGAGFSIEGINMSSTSVAFIYTLTNSGSIRNLTIKNSLFAGPGARASFVAYNKGTIQGVTLLNSKILRANSAGGIVGTNYGKVSNVRNMGGKIEAISAEASKTIYAAGIVAENNGTVDSAYNSSDVLTTQSNSYMTSYAGGIVGWNNITSSNVQFAYNQGTISANSNSPSGKVFIGGIIGDNWSSASFIRNDGDVHLEAVNCNDEFVGGIIGQNGQENYYDSIAQVSNMENHGRVTTNTTSSSGSPDIYVGGIVGGNSGTINNAANFAQITATNSNSHGFLSVGSLGGMNAYGKIKNSFAAGDSVQAGSGEKVYVGSISANGKHENCYYDKTVNPSQSMFGRVYQASDTVAVSAMETAEMKTTSFTEVLNTNNQTTESSKIWTRTSEYPFIAALTNVQRLPIHTSVASPQQQFIFSISGKKLRIQKNIGHITVFDLKGNLLFAGYNDTKETVISLPHTGVYLIRTQGTSHLILAR